MPGRASGVKMVGMADMWAPISLDVVAVHPDCWCICLRYLHFAPEIQKMANKDTIFGYHPTYLHKQEVWKDRHE